MRSRLGEKRASPGASLSRIGSRAATTCPISPSPGRSDVSTIISCSRLSVLRKRSSPPSSSARISDPASTRSVSRMPRMVRVSTVSRSSDEVTARVMSFRIARSSLRRWAASNSRARSIAPPTWLPIALSSSRPP
jgi:hypothetical protein